MKCLFHLDKVLPFLKHELSYISVVTQQVNTRFKIHSLQFSSSISVLRVFNYPPESNDKY